MTFLPDQPATRSPSRRRILVLESVRDQGEAVRAVLSGAGYEVDAGSAASAQEALDAFSPHLVIADLHQPVSPELRPVLVLADPRERDAAVCALRAGAAGYLLRPIDPEELVLEVKQILELEGLRGEVERLRRQTAGRRSVHRMVGTSPSIREAREVLLEASGSDGPVLIIGEEGTGKSLAARLLHEATTGRTGPFVAAASAHLSPVGLRSLLRAADGGTLFLDGVHQLPEPAQDELADWLAPSGEPAAGRPDVRIVSASDCELGDLVGLGVFRCDVGCYLGSIAVWLPPLRERRQDIPLLVEELLRRAGDGGPSSDGLSSQVLARLAARDWPGNVAELERVISGANEPLHTCQSALAAAVGGQGGMP